MKAERKIDTPRTRRQLDIRQTDIEKQGKSEIKKKSKKP